MKLKILKDKQIPPDLKLEKDKEYEVLDIIEDCYKIAIPRKQKGKFYAVLVKEDEGELIE